MRTETVLREERREEWPGWQPECRAGVAGGRAEGHRRTRECPSFSSFCLKMGGGLFQLISAGFLGTKICHTRVCLPCILGGAFPLQSPTS